MNDEDGNVGYGLVMPFTVVQSKGGPFEDAAFVAGWTCGMVDAALHAAEHVCAEIKFTVKPEVVPQLDLIAMHRGYSMETEEAPYDWTVAKFTKGTGVSKDSSGAQS